MSTFFIIKQCDIILTWGDKMDKENLEAIRTIMREELNPIHTTLNNLENDVKDLKKGQQEIKTLISELDPKNANRHLELSKNIGELSEKVDLLRHDLNKVEVVTSQNSFEIQYLKAVK